MGAGLFFSEQWKSWTYGSWSLLYWYSENLEHMVAGPFFSDTVKILLICWGLRAELLLINAEKSQMPPVLCEVIQPGSTGEDSHSAKTSSLRWPANAWGAIGESWIKLHRRGGLSFSAEADTSWNKQKGLKDKSVNLLMDRFPLKRM